MKNYAVIRTGGKQYLVREGDELIVDRLDEKEKNKVDLETLMIFDNEGKEVEIGQPVLNKKVKAEVLEHLKGDKIKIIRFKAKVRYRKRKGFRASLTKLKILKID